MTLHLSRLYAPPFTDDFCISDNVLSICGFSAPLSGQMLCCQTLLCGGGQSHQETFLCIGTFSTCSIQGKLAIFRQSNRDRMESKAKKGKTHSMVWCNAKQELWDFRKAAKTCTSGLTNLASFAEEVQSEEMWSIFTRVKKSKWTARNY